MRFGAGAIEFGAPFDELVDVLRAFFDEEGDRFGAAKTVAGVESVLFVQADFVFVGESDGDAALGPGGGGITEIGFSEDQDAACGAEFDGGAQSGYARTYDGEISVIDLWGRGHRRLSRGTKYRSRFWMGASRMEKRG